MGHARGHRQRMQRQFLEAGLDRPFGRDLAILEFILFYAVPRQDTNPIAHALLDRYGSLAGVLEAPVADLKQVEGIGDGGRHPSDPVPRGGPAAHYGADAVRRRSWIPPPSAASICCRGFSASGMKWSTSCAWTPS